MRLELVTEECTGKERCSLCANLIQGESGESAPQASAGRAENPPSESGFNSATCITVCEQLFFLLSIVYQFV